MISPLLYECSVQVELHGFAMSKIRKLIREIQDSKYFGGYSSRTLIITVKDFIPNTEEEIPFCYANNRLKAEQFIKIIEEAWD